MKSISFLYTFLFIIILSQVNAQNLPEAKKTYYKAEDGKLYWQGDKPVYLFVSENADGSGSQKLKSETSAKYTNPMYLDTEGINFFRSNWAFIDGKYPNGEKHEILFEIYKDSKPPVTLATFAGAPVYRGDQLYYGKNLNVEIKSKDQLSGVSKSYYSFNGKAFSEYSTSLSPNEDQQYIMKYSAVDNVGNVEKVIEKSFYVDLTSPETAHSIIGDNHENVVSARSKLSLSATDKSSGVKKSSYQLDDGTTKTFYSPIGLWSLQDGPHSLKYFSTDKVSNEEAAVTYNFYLDKTAPIVKGTIEGPKHIVNGKVYASGQSKIKLIATDNKAGVKSLEYKMGTDAKTSYASSISIPQKNGTPSVLFYCSDNVNNKTTKSFKDINGNGLIVDVTAPTISHNFIGEKYFARDTLFITTETRVDLRAYDGSSGVANIKYSYNGGADNNYSEPFTLSKEGHYKVSYSASDNVENSATKDFFVVVDNTGPVLKEILSMETVGTIKLDDFNQALPVYSKGTKFYLAATDEVLATKNIYYKINGGKEVMYRTPIVMDHKGVNTIVVRAVDHLMNESVSDPISIFIN